MKIKNIKFPTKRRWLKNWWSKNINTFLYATENPEVQERIKEFRNNWCDGEIAKNPDDLYKILLKMFLKEAGFKDFKIVKKNSHYETVLKNEDGSEMTTNNPFFFRDREIRVPEAKMALIKMLSNIDQKENKWILEPRLFINEDMIVYPSSHILISTLHKLGFFRYIQMFILGPLNLDYFVFWPLFFFYILTDNRDFVIRHAMPLIYPVRVYSVHENASDFLILRLYGDCNFNEIFNFIRDNKPNLNKLNKLMGNANVSAGSLRDFHIYQELKNKKDKEVALELIKNKQIKTASIKKDRNSKSYNDYLREGILRDSAYLKTSQAKKALEKEMGIVRTTMSQIKKEIANITKTPKSFGKIQKLIDKINTPAL